jgi:cytoskeletal protein CcmA (bactofilin family)
VVGEQSLASVIAKDTVVKGSINVDNKLFIDGCVEGIIESSMTVTIGKEGKIDGDVKINKLVVSGRAKGKIVCDTCEILSGGIVEGELIVKTLIVEAGGMIEGKTTMQKTEEKAE